MMSRTGQVHARWLVPSMKRLIAMRKLARNPLQDVCALGWRPLGPMWPRAGADTVTYDTIMVRILRHCASLSQRMSNVKLCSELQQRHRMLYLRSD